MKKFSFKLQAVLKYRKHLENLARQEAMKALMDVNECRQMIEQMHKERQTLAEHIDRETARGIPALLFRQYNDYMDSIENDIAFKEQEYVHLQKQLETKQQQLTKKSVDRKVIERLREKKRSEYIEEMVAEEQKIADDISSLKKAREASHELS
ncbi:FliJ [Desulfamplus magnetovallimortis]|uniref:Flagellar FliJ protein n=1 Tax=Desulfamplus magnetovallimortis TaxID=1246637 RepID=A0A1W1H9W2_9BACT|nr:flagellar export protein FliJ [Desulfamplus magnetovallimortis]SLM29257.1 FliJ [Desulfamplus magnetovallimortis]